MALTEEEREELDARARRGETVVPGGKGGRSLQAQEQLAQGRMKGGKTRKEQLGTEGYKQLGKIGGQVRKQQLGTNGYKELGRRGGLSSFRNACKFMHPPATFASTASFPSTTDEFESDDTIKEN